MKNRGVIVDEKNTPQIIGVRRVGPDLDKGS
jgi:hypothetical protein